MKLVRGSIKRPVGVVMVVIAALLLGSISLRGLAVELFPKMDLPVAVVATSYDGAAPQEMEELVSKPIESSVSGIEGIDTVQSVSQPSSSLVIMQFDFGRDIDNALNDVREKIDRVSGSLPEDANSPTVMRLDPNSTPIMWASLTGDDLSEMQDVAEDEIQPELERVIGIASADIQGGVEREVRVALDQGKLANYGITPSQVSQALSAGNHSISAGTVLKGNKDVQLRIDGEYTSVDDIRNTLVDLNNGDTVRIADVADVRDTFKDQSSVTQVNGKDAMIFSITKQSDGNTVDAAQGVQEKIDNLNSKLKERDLELTTVIDTSTFITDSMKSVIQNMIVGAVMAAIVLLLFLRSVRATLVVGISMPIAVISTFSLMYFTGETLNILSMGGLALGIGMMVDSSIVILENIFKKRQEGLSTEDAAIEGGSELSSAVIASTITSVVVFLPVVFIDGIAAQLFKPLALTVVFALSASLIAALTLIPMLSSKLLAKVNVSFDGEDNKGIVNWLLNKLIAVYEKVLAKALRLRKTVVFLVGLLLVGSLALVPAIGVELQPSTDSGQAQIEVTLDNGTKLDETQATVKDIKAKLKNYDDIIKTSFVMVGGGGTPGVGGSSTNTASFMIELIDSGKRDITTDTFISKVDQDLGDIPGAEITVSASSAGMGTGSPIQVNLSGDDLDVLRDLSQQIVWMLEDTEGTMNVDSSASEGNPEVQIDVDRDVASRYGLSYQQVMNEVNLAFKGQVATKYKEDGSEYDVTVALPEKNRETIRDLETLVIKNAQGVDVPLTAVADLKQTQGPSEINRKDEQRQVKITSDVTGRDLGSVSQEIQGKLDQMNLPDGYDTSMGGETEQVTESFTQLGLAFVLSIVLVYMVMAFQFESFTYPFIIMFSLPTMVIGIILGLFVTNIPLSITALIGLIMLAGIVVNNGIILVDYINILRRKGIDRIEAIIEAGKSRMRPILMTTLTTALAMVPLALAIGEGAETQQPMAVVVIFGLLSSTIFTLVFVPVMYVIIDNISNTMKRLVTRNKSEELE
ncbi:efflux RND transporter permease subunit [Lentibacillus cibarius]|uniref:Efflux RND transporter permease subunit n=1 Tax=Lentibacillus cibarius TaxID=2583219 RepID=A0A5S3QKR1_9BACI|nr:efflux RND transporter permease subunit [Lentibacillus cibarius]TMN21791.1 efflux RND transporter permease subunit [Lentibacillus cibarius]